MKTLLPALALTLLLAGCDTAVETMANNIDDKETRQEVIKNCSEEMQQPEDGEPGYAADAAEKICGCGYDQVSAQYPDRTAWRKALISHELGRETKESKEIFDKLVTALQNCIAEHDAAAAPQ